MHIFLSLQGSHKSTSLIAAVLEPSLYSAAATTVSAFIVKQSKPEGYGTSWYSLKHKHPQMKKCNLAIKQHAPPFNLSQQSSYLNAYKTTVQFILSWFSLRYVIIWKSHEENFTLSTQLKKKYDQSLLQNIRLMAFRKDPVLFFFQVFLNLWFDWQKWKSVQFGETQSGQYLSLKWLATRQASVEPCDPNLKMDQEDSPPLPCALWHVVSVLNTKLPIQKLSSLHTF